METLVRSNVGQGDVLSQDDIGQAGVGQGDVGQGDVGQDGVGQGDFGQAVSWPPDVIETLFGTKMIVLFAATV